MRYSMKWLIVPLLAGGLVVPAQALEVDRKVQPRFTLAGKMISTLDVHDNGSKADHISMEDSTVLFRFDKRLYRKGVAGVVLGIEEENNVTRFQQMHGFYWDRDVKLEIGRTRLRNTLLEFPILRDEDLVEFTHVGNASSSRKFDQVYGELVSVDWFVDGKVQRVGMWAGGRRDEGDPSDPGEFDSYGLSYVYELPESLRYVKYLRHAGLRLESQKVPAGDLMRSLVAGLEVNLNINPQASWSLVMQAIVNDGVSGWTDVSTVASRAQVASTAVVGSVRYNARPHLLTRWQAALTLAWKNYDGINDAALWSVAPSLFWRVGQGVDVVAQAIHRDYGIGLARGGSETVYQIGMAFNLETVFGDNIGERDSILNLEHGYIQ